MTSTATALRIMRILSALVLIATGAIHLFLVFDGGSAASWACCSSSTPSRHWCSRSR